MTNTKNNKWMLIIYSLGITKSPILLDAGWQISQLLREVNSTQNNYSQSYSRFSISICEDIPLLNFHSS